MKIAVRYLKKELENQIDDFKNNKSMLNNNSNSIEMNKYFKNNIEENKKAIESIRKAIAICHLTKKKPKKIDEFEFFEKIKYLIKVLEKDNDFKIKYVCDCGHEQSESSECIICGLWCNKIIEIEKFSFEFSFKIR
jgi:hypothetical protein